MGVWGTGLYSDDVAEDIRDEYKELVAEGQSAAEATSQITREWQDTFEDPEDGPVAWFALAQTQWKLGRLQEYVKSKALSLIESRRDLERWDGADKKKREKVLEKLKQQLNSPQPKKRKLRKPFHEVTDWTKGEIVAYTTLSGSKVLFRVIGFYKYKDKSKVPICELLDWQGDKIPGRLSLMFKKVRKKVYPHGDHSVTQFSLSRMSVKDVIPQDRVVRTGMKMRPSQKPGSYYWFSWAELDRQLKELLDVE